MSGADNDGMGDFGIKRNTEVDVEQRAMSPAPHPEESAGPAPTAIALIDSGTNAGPSDLRALSWMFADVHDDHHAAAARFATMSREQLFEAASAPGADIAAIVKARPAEAGELMQLAITSKRPDITMQLMQSVRSDYLASMGQGAEAKLLFRSALRVDGPEAAQVQGVMRWIIHERDQRATNTLTKALQPAGTQDLSVERQMLDHAAADPGFGKLYANFFDRPESATAQLLQERERDPAAFERHASQLTGMMSESPAATRDFVHEVNKLQGSDAVAVKEWTVAQLHATVSPLIKKMERGEEDFINGGVKGRAERYIPLLAETVAQPDVSQAMIAPTDGVERMQPPGMPSLKHALDDVQRAEWSKGVHDEVHSTIGRNAAELFRSSLLAPPGDEQDLLRHNAAAFMSTAARSDADVGAMGGWQEAVSVLLTNMGSYIPGVGKFARLGGQAVGAMAPMHQADWSRHAMTSMMRRTYESVHPVPDAPQDSDEMRAYNARYVSWKQTPEMQFNEALDRKGQYQ